MRPIAWSMMHHDRTNSGQPHRHPRLPHRRSRPGQVDRAGRAAVLTAAASLVLTAAASQSVNRDRGDSPERDPALIAALSSPDWAVREAATARLRTSRTLDPGTLVTMNAADLPLEARFRLLSACFDTYVTAPMGALGVRQENPRRGGVGVTLREVIAGFDVARKLRPQDVIHSIDGMPMNDTDDLALAVQRRRPGDTVVIEYQRPERDGARIVRDEQNQVVYGPRTRVEVTLGQFNSLPSDEWSGTRLVSGVPVERRNDWIIALARTGALPRVMEMPAELTAEGPDDDEAPADEPQEDVRTRGGRR